MKNLLLALLILMLAVSLFAQGTSSIVIKESGKSDVTINLTAQNVSAFAVYGWTLQQGFQNFLDSLTVNAIERKRGESVQKLNQIKDPTIKTQLSNQLDAATAAIDAQVETEKPK